MTAFIFTDIFMISISVVLYLMVRALPRVTEEAPARAGFLDRLAHSELPEKLDAALNGFLIKFLRKAKVAILKIDNLLYSHLQNIRSKETVEKTGIDFKEMAEENKETEIQ